MIIKKLVYLIFMLLGGTALHAQQDTVRAAKAQQFVGKTVLLCDRAKNGHMDNISKDEPTIIYVSDTYETRTLALIFAKDVLRTFSFDPEKRWRTIHFAYVARLKCTEASRQFLLSRKIS